MKNKLSIIPVSQTECQGKSWKTYLKEAVSDPQVLLQKLSLEPQSLNFGIDLNNQFTTRVPQPFVDKMELGNPNDPLLLQVLSQQKENIDVTGFSRDPLLEQENQQAGLLHKYQGRVLLILTSACAVNCRYCFRRHFPYEDNQASGEFLEKALQYIANDPSITEVILSGGDPLLVSDDFLIQLINQLESISHLKRLRIHTRLPIVIPQRITPEMCLAFESSRFDISVVLHINHAHEIDELLEQYLKRLAQADVILLNQSVLLKNINDNLDILCELSERLFSVGVIPYYLHQLDKVAGAAHFDVSEAVAKNLVEQMRQGLPGYLVPRLAREDSQQKSKTILA